MPFSFKHPYQVADTFSKPVAYFCMEYAIHQPLKIYAGGLGFLAGSHLRSAYDLKQNFVGIGILWKYGYYDQIRKSDQNMDILFQEKVYGFLTDTKIKFSLKINQRDVWVTAYYLDPQIFNTSPLFLLSTDIPENDYASRTITYKLYDANPELRLAAAIVLGAGGAKLLDLLNWKPEIYHLNESHGLPLGFYLYNQYKKIEDVRKRLVFTNHTPEESGNLKTDILLLERIGFFCNVPLTEVRAISQSNDHVLDHTLCALQFSKIANAVSKIHLQTLTKIWNNYPGKCPLISITNAQNFNYWASSELYGSLAAENDKALTAQKLKYKEILFEVIADQNGEIFKKDILTIVFAKRFTGYKRPDMLLRNMPRFEKIISDTKRPVQIIWSGKPYPLDYSSIGVFDKIVNVCKQYNNCATLVGYELRLSRLLKQGADVWLNLPRLTHEASGTSGMSAAMNGAINVSIPDGWIAEFAKDKENSFIIPAADPSLPEHIQDDQDSERLYDLLEKEVIPMYYDYPSRWLSIQKAAMHDIIPTYDSNRMTVEYYDRMYTYSPK